MFQPGEGKCHTEVAWLDSAGALAMAWLLLCELKGTVGDWPV